MRVLLSLHWLCFVVVILQTFWHMKTALTGAFDFQQQELNSTYPQKLVGNWTNASTTTLIPTSLPAPLNNHHQQQQQQDDKVKKDIPILVISSLRADYLEMVVDAIQPSKQNPNTPSWILNSRRYVFAHKNKNTDKGNQWQDTQTVCQKYGYGIHVFKGLKTYGSRNPQNPIRAYYTKHTWYRMMRYLFYTLNETEVLILEDDAVFAPDGLLMAAAMFEEKRNPNRTDVIHGIAMGGHAGENKVNANPNEFMAVHPRYFQAMAYSMSVDVFAILDQNFKQVQAALKYMTPNQLEEENDINMADWTMEITERDLLPQFTQLQPSVGRMHHIGLQGMGYDGNGKLHKPFPIPWANWEATVAYGGRSLDDLYLYPPQVTDSNGYICDPPEWYCPGLKPTRKAFGYRKVNYRSLQEKAEYKRKRKDVYTPGLPHPLFPHENNNLEEAINGRKTRKNPSDETTTTTTEPAKYEFWKGRRGSSKQQTSEIMEHQQLSREEFNKLQQKRHAVQSSWASSNSNTKMTSITGTKPTKTQGRGRPPSVLRATSSSSVKTREQLQQQQQQQQQKRQKEAEAAAAAQAEDLVEEEEDNKSSNKKNRERRKTSDGPLDVAQEMHDMKDDIANKVLKMMEENKNRMKTLPQDEQKRVEEEQKIANDTTNYNAKRFPSNNNDPKERREQQQEQFRHSHRWHAAQNNDNNKNNDKN